MAHAAVVRLKGYRVLASGEIDIVARRGDTVATVAFVEVKVRPTLDEAREAIGVVKRRRISRAARRTLGRHL
jgi:putative endonuclease